MQKTRPKHHETHFIAHGRGAPVILVHGVAASLHGWDHLVPDLTREGFRVYALDLLGHGESAKPDDPDAYHVEAVYRQLANWLIDLDLAIPPVLVGHSLGGSLSLMYAYRQPDQLRGLVLVNPVVGPGQPSALIRWVQRRPELGARALERTPQWLIEAVLGWESEGARFSPSERKRQAADFKRADSRIIGILPTVQDLTPCLPAITTKALVIWGRHDRSLKPSHFRRLVEAMPNAVGHEMVDCGHQPHISSPSAFNRLVIDFLRTL